MPHALIDLKKKIVYAHIYIYIYIYVYIYIYIYITLFDTPSLMHWIDCCDERLICSYLIFYI